VKRIKHKEVPVTHSNSTGFSSDGSRNGKTMSYTHHFNDYDDYLVTPTVKPSISIPLTSSMSHNDFPQPSPAACGKRKQAELAAAHVLVSSSSGRDPSQDFSGAEMLSKMKSKGTGASYRPGEIVRRQRPGLTLSIINPDVLNSGGTQSGDKQQPETPWENSIKALEASATNGSRPYSTIQVSTPSEQKDFLSKLRGSLKLADIDEFIKITRAAEASLVHANSSVPASAIHNEIVHENSSAVIIKPEAKRTNDNPILSKALNRKDNSTGTTILMEVCSTELDLLQDDILKLCSILISAGSSITLTDSNGSTCLHKAAARGYEKVGHMLIHNGCLINSTDDDGNAAIHIAAEAGHGKFLEMLIKLGANCHLRNALALTALDIAGSTLQTADYRDDLRSVILSCEPRLRTLILYHDDCLEHTARRTTDWEGPDRLKEIMSRIQRVGEFQDYELEVTNQFSKATVQLLGRAHSSDYIAFVDALSKQVNDSDISITVDGVVTDNVTLPFTPQVQRFLFRQDSVDLKKSEYCDTTFSSGTLKAARRAAGAVAHAVDHVMLGRNRNAFCVVRPPGHHAGFNGLLNGAKSCGFCIFNSVAAGALHALEHHNCERVAIIDLDIHHGNGTEDIVRRYTQPSRLFFFSVHLYDKEEATGYEFFPGSGGKDDIIHNIINVPIAPLWRHEAANNTISSISNKSDGARSSSSPITTTPMGREAYRVAISQRLIPSLRAFNPTLILLSAGFDALAGDVGNQRDSSEVPPVNGMDILPEDFEWATSEIMKVADLCSGGRLVSVLEGGYGCYCTAKPGSRGTRARAATPERMMDRTLLANAAVAHIHRLVDPYK
jgi:acetoin utilization deacetylase AcuC-like enzyme